MFVLFCYDFSLFFFFFFWTRVKKNFWTKITKNLPKPSKNGYLGNVFLINFLFFLEHFDQKSQKKNHFLAKFLVYLSQKCQNLKKKKKNTKVRKHSLPFVINFFIFEHFHHKKATKKNYFLAKISVFWAKNGKSLKNKKYSKKWEHIP